MQVKIKIFIYFLLVGLISIPLSAAELGYVAVKTQAPSNKEVKVHYRVPENFQENPGQLYRVLVIFGGRNSTGEAPAKGGMGFAEWADDLQIFIVSPGFKDDDYWYPEKWSGKALFKALKEIKKKYPVCDDALLFYGYSGGSQCANLFPAWKPESCTAWVSHACGVWHKPSKKMKDIPGLVTCGEADAGRYILSQNFVIESRKKGINILWKSFPNSPHDVPPDSVELARVFLKIHHEENINDLYPKNKNSESAKTSHLILFVGDDQEGRYWAAGSREIQYIEPEDRVEFSSRELAEAWGREVKSKWDKSVASK